MATVKRCDQLWLLCSEVLERWNRRWDEKRKILIERIPVTLYARISAHACKGYSVSARKSRTQPAFLIRESRSRLCTPIANAHKCDGTPHLYTFIHALTRRPGRSLVAGVHDVRPLSDMVFADEELVHACCTILLEWRTLLQRCHPLRLNILRLVRGLQNQRQL